MNLFRKAGPTARGPATRLFFVTDVHGSEDCFRKFLNAAAAYGVDALILGGDITGKTLVAFVEEEKDAFAYEFGGTRHVVRSPEEMETAERVLARAGVYSFRISAEELEAFAADQSRVEEVTREATLTRLRRWISLAEERLGDAGVRIFVSAGNDDIFEVDDVLRASSLVINHDGRVVELNEQYTLIGLGYANVTPWHCPRDIPDEELGCKIESLVAQVEDPRSCVFSLHVPPIDSGLDTCPSLDDSVDPPRVKTDSAGQPLLFGAGSRAVREAIEKYQPLLSLHGHIHESRGAVRLGRTLAINPGSEYTEGILRGALVTLDRDGVKSYQLTSG